MTYCSECGHALNDKPLEHEGIVPFCPNCRRYCFPVFNTAVSMLIIAPEREEILLVKQYCRPFWILVAGYVNKGETAEEAVAREMLEEVDLIPDRITFNKSAYFSKSNTLILNFEVILAPG